MAKQHLNIHIHGKVQGVFLRDAAKQRAQDMGIAGFIRNEPDGSVYAEVEGQPENLTAFANWLKKGPERAFVEHLDIEPSELKGFSEFVVQYHGE